MAAIALASAAPAQDGADDRAQVEEIVVIGQRSGVPLWTVRGDTTTLVLVGSIEGVSKTTHWNPAALTEALRKADRVTFPQSHAFTASPFALIGWLAKWKKMASLPEDQPLGSIAGPETMRRLASLRTRGAVRADYATRHPLHLADDIRDRAKGDVDFGRTAADHVRRVAKEDKLVRVPIERSKAKPLVKDLFASQPQEHLPCLEAAIALAEAGPGEVQARSDAWAARRVPDVLASPADKLSPACWPTAVVAEPATELVEEMKLLLADPQVTVAVLHLRTLAESGGVLDGLAAAGFDIQGPAWK
jgi:hypothetical protein